ncbi:hypothetical protein [Rhodopila sp.]|uniref:hypothetical protein n=1 Tax=Rhodopila sp. TaxID=2480087 RepID=UPI003D0BB951
MSNWHEVSIETKYHESNKPVYSRASEYYSTQKVLTWMQGHFRTAQDAKQAQEAHKDWQSGKADKTPDAERWSGFVSAIRQMERRYEHLGIQLARVERVDFSGVRKIERDTGWER